ncbi:MAG: family 10 glycosylhydrolase [Cyanobacteria bacterium P01_G01_bin.39]
MNVFPTTARATSPKEKEQANHLAKNDQDVLLADTVSYSPIALSSGQVRLMTNELQGLIDRFETTLFTADALDRDIDISTAEVIQGILGKASLTSKQNKSKYSYKSKYRNAHLALHQARQGLKRFHSLVDLRYYTMAVEEWHASKQALLDNYPRDRPVAESEVRGMWLDRGTIVKARSPEDLIPIFDRMAKAGINTVFFETINSGYTIYPSKIAPQQNPLVKGWDPLKTAITLAHERGIELHAWMWTFAAVNQRHNIILDLPRNYLGPVLSRRPDWAMTDREGSRFHYSSGKVFFDPANPQVQEYLSSLVTEIATEYDVDGIHLDYIRYPFQSPTGRSTYGYGNASRELFKKQTGLDPMFMYPEHPQWSEWIDFRIEQIDNFVATTAKNLKQLRPDLVLSTAVFPMPKRERLMKIQQNWETWIEREWIDMLVPMTYAENAEKLNTLANPLLYEFDRGEALLLPGIRLLNIPETTALDQMQLLRGMSTEGYSLFAAENLNSNLIDIFQSTQGSITAESRQPLPHRKPFDVSLNRYQSIQKEWNLFLIDRHQEFTTKTLEKWGDKADRLEKELQNLVEEPSHKNLFSTQVALRSLRQQFPSWIEEANSIDQYQAQIWQNRLDTLARLLNYGERKLLDSDRSMAGS